MIEKLLSGWKRTQTKGEPKEGEDKKEGLNEELLKSYKEKLKGIVYEDELVDQFAPIFVKLHEHDADGVVFELLENKEKQIQAIADGSAFKDVSGELAQDTEINQPQGEEDDKEGFSVESLIMKRGK